MKYLPTALFLTLALAACSPAEVRKVAQPEQAIYLKPVTFTDLPGWSQDNHAQALVPLQKSCTRIMKRDASAGIGDFAGTAGDWQAVCEKLSLLLLGTNAEALAYFEENFTPYRLSGMDGREGLFTGYYVPLLKGSREKKDPYLYPLYGRPNDLISVDLGAFRPDLKGETIAGRVDGEKLVPYADRRAIEAGAIENVAEKIIWVDDPVDVFFLHIQGSGEVLLDTGEKINVGYAAQNGHIYTAIGKKLIEMGEIARENVSMQSIRAWLEAHPDKAPDIMNVNASYVFFRTLDTDGVMGAEGVPLTPERSLAIDRRLIPYGVPMWIDAEHPDNNGTRLQRLMLAQDTGGAIRGAVRGDYFWGSGDEAARLAGIMKSRGESYVLLPKTVTPPTTFIGENDGQALHKNSFVYNP